MFIHVTLHVIKIIRLGPFQVIEGVDKKIEECYEGRQVLGSPGIHVSAFASIGAAFW